MSYTVRKAMPQDAYKLAELEKICFPKAEAATREIFIERLERYSNHFIVVEDENNMICAVNGLVTNEENLEDKMYSDTDYHNEDGKWQMANDIWC